MNILVTGGGGFLGSAICRQLLARHEQLIAYQRRPAPQLEARGARVVQGDLLDRELLGRTAAGCDAVIHTAGKAGVWGAYEQYYQTNVAGTDHVISACRENGVPWLVHTSSPSVVHGGGDIEGGDESLPYPPGFTAPYPETKALGEQLVMAANGVRLATVCLRPHLIWGPGDPHLLPRLLDKAAGGKLYLPGPDKLIDTIYVDNAAQAHVQALDALRDGRDCAGKTYFISNDDPRPQKDIIAGLLAAAGLPTEIRALSPTLVSALAALIEATWRVLRLDSEPPLTRWSAAQLSTAHWYDISAAKRDLGYRPGISIDEGLRRLQKHMVGG